jgi:arsenite methyltransferase
MASRGRSLDLWAQWLLERRHGGDAAYQQRVLEYLAPVREKVLDNAALADGDVVLDVGAGDGLIAFGALGRFGPTGRVIFSDVSQDLLDHSRKLADELGSGDRCCFVRAAAEDLAPIADTSVNVVTTRSVLIYVKEKEQAFREFYRVLRPGGRLSMFEPINRYFGYPSSWPYDEGPYQALGERVRAVHRLIHPPDDPMMDFDERDLLAYAAAAGFREVALEVRVDVRPAEPLPWETFLRLSGNPRIPTYAEAMAQTLTPAEIERYASHLRPLVEQGEGQERTARVYVRAIKG